MNINTLISEAKARQDARTEAYREEQERRAEQAGETLRKQFIAAFGNEMLTTLDGYVSSAFDDVARITFRYQDRNYSLRWRYSDGVGDWVLTWMAPREDGDDRRLLFATFGQMRNDTRTNIDALVLALSELSETEDTPRYQHRELPDPPAPGVMNEHERNLLDALRLFLQHEI